MKILELVGESKILQGPQFSEMFLPENFEVFFKKCLEKRHQKGDIIKPLKYLILEIS